MLTISPAATVVASPDNRAHVGAADEDVDERTQLALGRQHALHELRMRDAEFAQHFGHRARRDAQFVLRRRQRPAAPPGF